MLHRSDVELKILNRSSDVVGHRRTRTTENSKFEALTIFPASQIEGNLGPDWLSLTVRTSVQHAGLLNRSAITRGTHAASILANGCFIGAMNPGYSLRSVGIRRQFLEDHDELWIESKRFLQRSAVYSISAALFEKFNRTLHSLEYDDHSEEEQDHKICDLYLTLLACIDDSKELSTTNRHRIVVKAMLYMKNAVTRRVSPLELAEVCHCSPRTLQYAFRRTLGISAKNYIDRIRLAEFRKALLDTDDEGEQNLQDLAQEFGFSHGGNLSKSYRELFGRLPSQGCPCDAHDAEDDQHFG